MQAYVFRSPHINNIKLCWINKVINFLTKTHAPEHVVRVVRDRTADICTNVQRPWVEDILETYKNAVDNKYCIIIWGPESDIEVTCSSEGIEAVALLHLQTEPKKRKFAPNPVPQSSLDLVCAVAGRGYGTTSIRFIEQYVKDNTDSKRLLIKATYIAWPFYWKLGYRVDHNMTWKNVPVNKRDDFEYIKKLVDKDATNRLVPMYKLLYNEKPVHQKSPAVSSNSSPYPRRKRG